MFESIRKLLQRKTATLSGGFMSSQETVSAVEQTPVVPVNDANAEKKPVIKRPSQAPQEMMWLAGQLLEKRLRYRDLVESHAVLSAKCSGGNASEPDIAERSRLAVAVEMAREEFAQIESEARNLAGTVLELFNARTHTQVEFGRELRDLREKERVLETSIAPGGWLYRNIGDAINELERACKAVKPEDAARSVLVAIHGRKNTDRIIERLQQELDIKTQAAKEEFGEAAFDRADDLYERGHKTLVSGEIRDCLLAILELRNKLAEQATSIDRLRIPELDQANRSLESALHLKGITDAISNLSRLYAEHRKVISELHELRDQIASRQREVEQQLDSIYLMAEPQQAAR